MKLTVEIDYEECLKVCLDYAERKMKIFSEIIGKKIEMNELIRIMRLTSDKEKAKSVLTEEYYLTNDETALLMDMTLTDIVENKQGRLEYYRTSVSALSSLVGEKKDA